MVNVISGIGSVLRPAAKQVIKGGMVATNTVRELATNTGEGFKGLVSEARTELTQARVARHTDTSPQTSTESKGLWNRTVDACHAAWAATTGAAASAVSFAREEIVALVAWFYGESEEKAEQQVEKGRERIHHFRKEVRKDLVASECANVIETVILMAV